MSKATWDDTPPVRRLLARLKKDMPPAIDLDVLGALGGFGYQLEYDGDPVAVGNGGPVPMDTVYTSDTDTNVSRPIADGTFEHQLWRAFRPINGGYQLQIKQAGLWQFRYVAILDGPVTKPARFQASGMGGGVYLPAGVDRFDCQALVVISAEDGVIQLDGLVDAADSGRHYTYCWIAFGPVALTGKPTPSAAALP